MQEHTLRVVSLLAVSERSVDEEKNKAIDVLKYRMINGRLSLRIFVVFVSDWRGLIKNVRQWF